MKTITKNILIVSGISFVLGSIICTITLFSINFDFAKISSLGATYVDKQFDVSDSISLDISMAPYIFIGESTDDKVHITYYDTSRFKYEIKQNKENLTLKQILLNEQGQKRLWFQKLQFIIFSWDLTTTILIPAKFNGELIANISGNTITFENISANRINLSATAGYVKFKNISAHKIDVEMVGGLITTEQISVIDDVSFQISASYIKVQNVYSDNSINLSSSSGSVEFSKLDAQNITIDITTGSAQGSIVGDQNDFTVINTSTRDYKNIPKSSGQGHKRLNLFMNVGTVDFSFIE